ncbi:MAG: hypothetical protein HY862_20775 [Chloroflexi bacterium]|nr:hypothetical protein [Chloroflexota bacterium]
MIKLLLSWDIQPGQDQEHFEFMVQEFAPRLTTLGVMPIEAWYTMYGEKSPQIVVEAMTDDLQTMRRIMDSPEWDDLKSNLLKYVTNYKQKVIRGRSHLQL